MIPPKNPPFPVPPEILEIDSKFNPDHYIDRADSPIQTLIDWVKGNIGPHSKLFHRLEAPADCGKSWQMARLALEFWGDPNFFVAVLPAGQLIDVDAMNDWMDKQLGRLGAPPATENTISTRISNFHAALSNGGQHPRRHFLWLIDGLDEHRNPDFLTEKLIDPAINQFDHKGLSLIIACRDDFIIPGRILRKKKSDDIPLQHFSLAEGIQQLQNINPLPVPEADLLNLLAPYRLSVPGWNKCLYKKILAHHQAGHPHLLTADDVRGCWFSPLQKNIERNHFDAAQIVDDLLALADGVATSPNFTLKNFEEWCACETNEAGKRIKNLLELAVVISSSNLYRLVDGLADLIRAELRLQNQTGGQPHA